MAKKIRNSDKNERIVTFDVDDTLILWGDHKDDPNAIPIKDPYTDDVFYFLPHKKHIQLVSHFSNRGYYVIVWSAGGGLWANKVVDTLGIRKYVDDVMVKPLKYVDDLDCKEWMGNRIYIDPGVLNDDKSKAK
jgi:hypothetical protein